MFETVENKTVSQVVMEKIQDMIIDGELKIGDKLPPERELTEVLGVGRPALREALKALEVMGLIESRHGQGNFISNNIENSYFKPLSLSFKLNNGKIADILNLREALETFNAKTAAEKATIEDITRLYDIHKNMIVENDENKKAEFDREFHYEILKISSNLLFAGVWNSVSYLMDIFIDKTVHISLYTENAIDKVYDEHFRIIKAIESHDAEAASLAIEAHLKNINLDQLKEL